MSNLYYKKLKEENRNALTELCNEYNKGLIHCKKHSVPFDNLDSHDMIGLVSDDGEVLASVERKERHDDNEVNSALNICCYFELQNLQQHPKLGKANMLAYILSGAEDRARFLEGGCIVVRVNKWEMVIRKILENSGYRELKENDSTEEVFYYLKVSTVKENY